MKFLRQSQPKAVQEIAKRICQELTAGKRVLWLVSGGSNVLAEVAVMQLVRGRAEDKLAGLAILPMNEHWGKPGHAGSITQHLRGAGFDPGRATWVDVLIHNVPFDQTISFYTDVASAAFANAGIIIAQFGLGTDGHVAGILPGSPAATADEVTVAGYQRKDYTRLTLTPVVFEQAQVAYVLAYGEAKKEALQRLQANTEDLVTLPAKLLYHIPEVYVYNDQLENQQNKE